MKPATKILMQEIFETTINIQNQYPELYNLLLETPLILSYNEAGISDEACKQYLESLQLEMQKFTEKIKISKLEKN